MEKNDTSDSETDFPESDDSNIYGDLVADSRKSSIVDDADDADIFLELGSYYAGDKSGTDGGGSSLPQGAAKGTEANVEVGNSNVVDKSVVDSEGKVEKNDASKTVKKNKCESRKNSTSEKRTSVEKKAKEVDSVKSKGTENCEIGTSDAQGCGTRSKRRTVLKEKNSEDGKQKGQDKSEQASKPVENIPDTPRKRCRRQHDKKQSEKVAKADNKDMEFVMSCLTQPRKKSKNAGLSQKQSSEDGIANSKKQDESDPARVPKQAPKGVAASPKKQTRSASLTRTRKHPKDGGAVSPKKHSRTASLNRTQKQTPEDKSVNAKKEPSKARQTLAKKQTQEGDDGSKKQKEEAAANLILVQEKSREASLSCTKKQLFEDNPTKVSVQPHVTKLVHTQTQPKGIDLSHVQHQPQTSKTQSESFLIINKLLGNTMQNLLGKSSEEGGVATSSSSPVPAQNLVGESQPSNGNAATGERDRANREKSLPKGIDFAAIASALAATSKKNVIADIPPALRRSPRKAKGKKSLQLDLYEDFLITKTEEKKKEEVTAMQSENEAVQAKLAATEEKCMALDEDNKTLLLNISSLWKTAMSQIQEKCTLIAQLKREKESIIFRRAMRQVPRDELDRIVSRIAGYNNEEFSSFMESVQKEGQECSCGGVGKGSFPAKMTAKKIKECVVGSRVSNLSDAQARLLQISLGKQGEKMATAVKSSTNTSVKNSGNTPKGQSSKLERDDRARYSSPNETSHGRNRSEYSSCRGSLNERFSRSLDKNSSKRGKGSKSTDEVSRSYSPVEVKKKRNKSVFERLSRQRDEDCDDENRGEGGRERSESSRHERRRRRDDYDSTDALGHSSDGRPARSRVKDRDLQDAYFEPNDRTHHETINQSTKKTDERYFDENYKDIDPSERRKGATNDEREMDQCNGRRDVIEDKKTSGDETENRNCPEDQSYVNTAKVSSVVSHRQVLEASSAEEMLLTQSLYGRRMLARYRAMDKVKLPPSDPGSKTPESVKALSNQTKSSEIVKGRMLEEAKQGKIVSDQEMKTDSKRDTKYSVEDEKHREHSELKANPKRAIKLREERDCSPKENLKEAENLPDNSSTDDQRQQIEERLELSRDGGKETRRVDNSTGESASGAGKDIDDTGGKGEIPESVTRTQRNQRVVDGKDKVTNSKASQNITTEILKELRSEILTSQCLEEAEVDDDVMKLKLDESDDVMKLTLDESDDMMQLTLDESDDGKKSSHRARGSHKSSSRRSRRISKETEEMLKPKESIILDQDISGSQKLSGKEKKVESDRSKKKTSDTDSIKKTVRKSKHKTLDTEDCHLGPQVVLLKDNLPTEDTAKRKESSSEKNLHPEESNKGNLESVSKDRIKPPVGESRRKTLDTEDSHTSPQATVKASLTTEEGTVSESSSEKNVHPEESNENNKDSASKGRLKRPVRESKRKTLDTEDGRIEPKASMKDSLPTEGGTLVEKENSSEKTTKDMAADSALSTKIAVNRTNNRKDSLINDQSEHDSLIIDKGLQMEKIPGPGTKDIDSLLENQNLRLDDDNSDGEGQGPDDNDAVVSDPLVSGSVTTSLQLDAASEEAAEPNALKDSSPDIEVLYEDIIKKGLSSKARNRNAKKSKDSFVKERQIIHKSSREMTLSQITEEEKSLSPTYMKSIMETVQFVINEESSCDSELIDVERLSDEDGLEDNSNKKNDLATEKNRNYGKSKIDTSKAMQHSSETVTEDPGALTVEETIRCQSPPLSSVGKSIEKKKNSDEEIHEGGMTDSETTATTDKRNASRVEYPETSEESNAPSVECPETSQLTSLNCEREKIANSKGSDGCRDIGNDSMSDNEENNAKIEDREQNNSDNEELESNADDKEEIQETEERTSSRNSSYRNRDQWLYPQEEELLYDEGSEDSDGSNAEDERETDVVGLPAEIQGLEASGMDSFDEASPKKVRSPKKRLPVKSKARVPEAFTKQKERVNLTKIDFAEKESKAKSTVKGSEVKAVSRPDQSDKEGEDDLNRTKQSRDVSSTSSQNHRNEGDDEVHLESKDGRVNPEGSSITQITRSVKLPRIKKLSKSASDELKQALKESQSPLMCEENVLRDRSAKDKSHLHKRGPSPIRTRRSPLKGSGPASQERYSSQENSLSKNSRSRSPEKSLPQRKSQLKSLRSGQVSPERYSAQGNSVVKGSRSRSPEKLSPRRKSQLQSSRSRSPAKVSPQRNGRGKRSSPQRPLARRIRADPRDRSGRDGRYDRDRKRRRSISPKESGHSISSKRNERELGSGRPTKRRRVDEKDANARLFGSDEETEKTREEKRRRHSPEEPSSSRRLSQRIKDRSRERRRYSPEEIKRQPRKREIRKENRKEEMIVHRNEEERRRSEVKSNKKVASKVIPVDKRLLQEELSLSSQRHADENEKEDGELEEEEDGELENALRHENEKEEGELEEDGELDNFPRQLKTADKKTSHDKSDRSAIRSRREEKAKPVKDENAPLSKCVSRRGLDMSKTNETANKQSASKTAECTKGIKAPSRVERRRGLEISVTSKGKTNVVTSNSKTLKTFMEEETTFYPSDLYQPKALPFVTVQNITSFSRTSGSDDTIDMIVKEHNENCLQDAMNSSDDSEMSLLHFIDDQPSGGDEAVPGTEERRDDDTKQIKGKGSGPEKISLANDDDDDGSKNSFKGSFGKGVKGDFDAKVDDEDSNSTSSASSSSDSEESEPNGEDTRENTSTSNGSCVKDDAAMVEFDLQLSNSRTSLVEAANEARFQEKEENQEENATTQQVGKQKEKKIFSSSCFEDLSRKGSKDVDKEQSRKEIVKEHDESEEQIVDSIAGLSARRKTCDARIKDVVASPRRSRGTEQVEETWALQTSPARSPCQGQTNFLHSQKGSPRVPNLHSPIDNQTTSLQLPCEGQTTPVRLSQKDRAISSCSPEAFESPQPTPCEIIRTPPNSPCEVHSTPPQSPAAEDEHSDSSDSDSSCSGCSKCGNENSDSSSSDSSDSSSDSDSDNEDGDNGTSRKAGAKSASPLLPDEDSETSKSGSVFQQYGKSSKEMPSESNKESEKSRNKPCRMETPVKLHHQSARKTPCKTPRKTPRKTPCKKTIKTPCKLPQVIPRKSVADATEKKTNSDSTNTIVSDDMLRSSATAHKVTFHGNETVEENQNISDRVSSSQTESSANTQISQDQVNVETCNEEKYGNSSQPALATKTKSVPIDEQIHTTVPTLPTSSSSDALKGRVVRRRARRGTFGISTKDTAVISVVHTTDQTSKQSSGARPITFAKEAEVALQKRKLSPAKLGENEGPNEKRLKVASPLVSKKIKTKYLSLGLDSPSSGKNDTEGKCSEKEPEDRVVHVEIKRKKVKRQLNLGLSSPDSSRMMVTSVQSTSPKKSKSSKNNRNVIAVTHTDGVIAKESAVECGYQDAPRRSPRKT